MAEDFVILTVAYGPTGSRGSWAARLVYRGPNENNKSGTSAKWWRVVCRNGRAEINFGKLGSAGRSSPLIKSASEALEVLRAKVREGYVFDPTFRVSDAFIAAMEVKGWGAPKAPLAHLGAPFDRIVYVRHGLDAKSYAFDANEEIVCVIPRSEAETLLRQYPDLSP